MSATVPDPAGQAPADPDSGDPGSDSQASTAPETPSGGGRDSLIAQVRGGGDFAESQFKQLQSRADRAEAQLRKVEPLAQELREWVEGGASPRDIAAAVRQYVSLSQDPEIVRILQARQNGGGAEGEDDSEYQTPEEKKIAALEQQVQKLSEQLSGVAFDTGSRGFDENLAKVFDDFPFDSATRDRIDANMREHIKKLREQPGGDQTIRALAGEQGLKTVKALVFQDLSAEDIAGALSNRASRKKQSLRALATDVPSSGAGADEPTPDFDGPDAALKALLYARENPDRIG